MAGEKEPRQRSEIEEEPIQDRQILKIVGDDLMVDHIGPNGRVQYSERAGQLFVGVRDSTHDIFQYYDDPENPEERFLLVRDINSREQREVMLESGDYISLGRVGSASINRFFEGFKKDEDGNVICDGREFQDRLSNLITEGVDKNRYVARLNAFNRGDITKGFEGFPEVALKRLEYDPEFTSVRRQLKKISPFFSPEMLAGLMAQKELGDEKYRALLELGLFDESQEVSEENLDELFEIFVDSYPVEEYSSSGEKAWDVLQIFPFQYKLMRKYFNDPDNCTELTRQACLRQAAKDRLWPGGKKGMSQFERVEIALDQESRLSSFLEDVKKKMSALPDGEEVICSMEIKNRDGASWHEKGWDLEFGQVNEVTGIEIRSKSDQQVLAKLENISFNLTESLITEIEEAGVVFPDSPNKQRGNIF